MKFTIDIEINDLQKTMIENDDNFLEKIKDFIDFNYYTKDINLKDLEYLLKDLPIDVIKTDFGFYKNIQTKTHYLNYLDFFDNELKYMEFYNYYKYGNNVSKTYSLSLEESDNEEYNYEIVFMPERNYNTGTTIYFYVTEKYIKCIYNQYYKDD